MSAVHIALITKKFIFVLNRSFICSVLFPKSLGNYRLVGFISHLRDSAVYCISPYICKLLFTVTVGDLPPDAQKMGYVIRQAESHVMYKCTQWVLDT
ncbi:hypothetical protein GDO86_017327 [Hymenochirus boettgeri]|uniref:Uncharacterized protein n=1 Tax=Hymenochirus boettgeri TaxID=247094 RepID=A0A8T2IMK4_9PIPI|nr:hypothetical protein GDO86_017327 [Hymenochirus boettgeri]